MKIIIVDKSHSSLLSELEKINIDYTIAYTWSKEKVLQEINNYEGLIIRSRFSIDSSFIDSAKNIKFIARIGAGLENINTTYAKSKGITIISSPQGNANAVGEHALALLLNILNNVSRAYQQIQKYQWIREENRGEELDGKTVGIIGYGNTGKAFASKIKGFDTDVLCYDIKTNVGDQNARQTSLKELQKKTDILSLHLPHTELTKEMINTNFIDEFHKPFWLINTARGSCVNIKDLVDALKKEKIKGAGLDVLSYEKSSFEELKIKEKIPIEYQELLQADNVIITPHIAGWSFQSERKMIQIIVDEIKNNILS